MLEAENQVLGASNRLFHTNPPTEVLADRSTFSMERLQVGATCQDVLAALDLLRPGRRSRE